MPFVRDRYTEFLLQTLLTKNIGHCFRFSSSLNKATLIETFEIAR